MNSYPVDAILPDLKEALLRNPAVVLHAPPGAGKTTRVPLALLDLIPAGKGRILMLEPRRIAAVSAARWMAGTLGEEAGETVGYSIRFESRVSASTRIEVVTEGILTRRIQNDPGLDGVSVIIFDEFHERSLHGDLALALSLDVRNSLREDLKILVMSATLDCGPIASLLGGVPVITCLGRVFPVEERYMEHRREKALKERVTDAVRLALKETNGDILVFLPGSGEIRACADALMTMTKGHDPGISIHPLYGDLSFEEQEKAILPSKMLKIVLATNIAETSLTIEGVRVVIDSGLTRRLQHDPSNGMNRLITVSESRASAEQRKGRAGRIAPGTCYRLYSRHGYRSMVPFSPAEMLVSDLSTLALELHVWGVKDPGELLWLDAPPSAAWDAARRLLGDLGAIDRSGSVTSAGAEMARLPLHPRLARMMLMALELDHLHIGADLAALISERDIFSRSSAGGRVCPQEPDISERLEVLQRWRDGKGIPDSADSWALRAVDRSAGQLVRLMRGKRGRRAVKTIDHDTVSRLLLSAFPDRVAVRRDEGGGRFVLTNGRGVKLPSLCRMSRSPFIVAVNVDAGEGAEGIVHLAAPLTRELVRQECAGRIETVRRVAWDKREARLVAATEERLGAVLLSSKPFSPSDEEAGPLLCEAIKSTPGMIIFSGEARQLQGRVGLMRKIFPEEDWPDLSDEYALSAPEEWLLPWLSGMRSSRDLAGLDIPAALRARLSWQKMRFLDEYAPAFIVVPSGHRVALDYSAGDVPVLAVKLQEMFGLADTPTIARGKVKVLLHLLSPARRPVQITQDLKGFWNSGYHEVKKELKGRYPKHPWPDDPWNAVPTRRAKRRGE